MSPLLITTHSRKGHSRRKGSEVSSGGHPAHMSQPNRVGLRISPRSLAGHERLPVKLSHVVSAKRYTPSKAESATLCGESEE
jgi:hypothetical protein